jgi:CspA family cold shock protein
MPDGTVTDFDESRGLGEVTDENGTVYTFHCVEIADGTRSIAVGTPVRFDVMAKFGRYESARISARTASG